MDARTSRFPFYLRRQRRELRGRIYDEADKLRTLRGTALAIVDYVYSFVSPDQDTDAPYFAEKTDWVLEPDNWVALAFGGRKGSAIHVSVGTRTISARADLHLSRGRFPDWTKIHYHITPAVTVRDALPRTGVRYEIKAPDIRNGMPMRGAAQKAIDP